MTVYSGTVIAVRPVHKLALKFFKKSKENLPRRWVVWSSTVDSESLFENPVWLRNVEDDSDALPLRQRSLLVKTFFEMYIGQTIKYSLKSGEWYKDCYSVGDKTLPKLYQVDSFSDIHKWFKKNRPECLEGGLKILREKKTKAIAVTKKKNAVRRKDKAIREQEEFEKRRRDALKLSFIKGRNPKHGTEQWEARHKGRLYILAREFSYEPSEGAIPIEKAFDLVPDRIVLVDRI